MTRIQERHRIARHGSTDCPRGGWLPDLSCNPTVRADLTRWNLGGLLERRLFELGERRDVDVRPVGLERSEISIDRVAHPLGSLRRDQAAVQAFRDPFAQGTLDAVGADDDCGDAALSKRDE